MSQQTEPTINDPARQLSTKRPRVTKVQAGRSVLSIIRDSLFLLAIYGYFTGFVFQYYYFSNLGLEESTADVQTNQLYVYAYSVLADNWIVLLVLAISYVIARIAAAQLTHLRSRLRAISTQPIAIAIGVLLFPLLAYAAQDSASRRVHELINEQRPMPGATFSIENPRVFDSTFIAANNAGTLHLLGTGKDGFYVYYQPSADPGDSLPPPLIYYIRREDVSHFRLQLLDQPDQVQSEEKKGIAPSASRP